MSTTCLIADDSLFARMLVKDAIGEIFAEVNFIEAASGEETLVRQGKSEKPIDWYLLDINMGSPDGLVTASKLIERGIDHSRIAFITGNRSADLKEQAKDLDICFINKAISPTDVEGFIIRLKEFFSA